MASALMVDPDEVDFGHVEYPIEKIREFIPQRYEMEQLHGVFRVFRDRQIAVGWRDVRAGEFWEAGHIPGRPLFPGVLMLEAGAQLATFLFKLLSGDDPKRFLGFGGLEKVKFRAPVEPGQRLLLFGKLVEARSRRCIFDTQGAVDKRLVFEAQVTGVPF